MSDDPDRARIDDELGRLKALREVTVAEAIGKGWRLKVGCIACDRPKGFVRLEDLALKHRDTLLKDLPIYCAPCRRRRNKPFIGPAGSDVVLYVVYPGED